MDAAAIASQLASSHPDARLPCPVCACSVKGRNLDRHVGEQHERERLSLPTQWAGQGWLGVLPASLSFDGAGALVIRQLFGLASRRIALDGALEIEFGSLWGTRLDPTMTSYADDTNVAGDPVRTGSYLRLVGPSSVTIGCRGGSPFADHWSPGTWKRGERRRSCDIRVDRTAIVAIAYALAQQGHLVPATDPGGS